MTFRSIRRRWGRWRARYDWLEGWLTALGVVFLALAAVCVWATVVVILHVGDRETGFPAGEGAVKAAKGLGLVLFPLLGAICLAVGVTLVRPWLRMRRSRRREH